MRKQSSQDACVGSIQISSLYVIHFAQSGSSYGETRQALGVIDGRVDVRSYR